MRVAGALAAPDLPKNNLEPGAVESEVVLALSLQDDVWLDFLQGDQATLAFCRGGPVIFQQLPLLYVTYLPSEASHQSSCFII